MIGIIDYGSGNVHAIANIYKQLNIEYIVSNNLEELDSADKFILPGVGDFDDTMEQLRNKNLIDFLNNQVLVLKKPIVGVCVGMQIMAKSSEEGQTPGFGWIDATVKQLDSSKLAIKPYLPHLGWNQSIPVIEHPLFMGINEERGFYFLHSYYMDCNSSSDIISHTFYGESFCSVVQHENVYGIQFHPEKSHENGLLIFKNFANL